MKGWTRRRAVVTGVAGAPGASSLLLAACGASGQGGGDAAPKPGTAPVTITTQLTDVNPTMASSWATEITAPYKQQHANVTLAVAPAPALRVSTPDVNSHGLFLVKGTKNQGDAWEAIKYFSEKSRLATFATALTTLLADLEGALRELAKPHPGVDPKAVKQMIETAKRGVNLKRHINQDEMLRVINPAMTELAENKVPAADLMRRIKPQLQALADQKQ